MRRAISTSASALRSSRSAQLQLPSLGAVARRSFATSSSSCQATPATLSDLQVSQLQIELTKNPKTRPPASKLIFGHTFTDHMLTIPWSESTGWGAPEIKPCECGAKVGARTSPPVASCVLLWASAKVAVAGDAVSCVPTIVSLP